MNNATAVEEVIDLIRGGMLALNAINDVCERRQLSLFNRAIVVTCIDGWQQHEHAKTVLRF